MFLLQINYDRVVYLRSTETNQKLEKPIPAMPNLEGRRKLILDIRPLTIPFRNSALYLMQHIAWAFNILNVFNEVLIPISFQDDGPYTIY